MNLLDQGMGGCDVAGLEGAAERLAGRDLVVLPRRTAASLDDDLAAILAREVEGGLRVLVEAPDSSRCRDYGLQLAAVERRPLLPWPKPIATATRRQLELRPTPVEAPWTRGRVARSRHGPG